jgi:3,5-epimerase/4-reductase
LEDSTIIYFLAEKFDPSKDRNIYWNSPDILGNWKSDIPKSHLNISEKDMNASYYRQYRYIVLGANGFLGSECVKYIGDDYLPLDTRLHDIEELRKHITKSGCKFVICAAGISGRPTTEWCEHNEKETFEVNYLNMLQLMKLCEECNVHLTIFGSGMVFTGTQDQYSEHDAPDLINKVYSRYRVELEKTIHLFPNVLYLRILYPCSLDNNPKCFVMKMKSRTKCVHNVDVSLTIISELFPHIPTLLNKNTTGVLNFVNKGKISLPRLLELHGTECDKIVEPENSFGSGYGLSCDRLEKILEIKVSDVETAMRKHIH